MQIDRSMVRLFFQIKEKLPNQFQEKLKLSAPNLGEMMIAIYRNTTDKEIKSLSESFLEKAGEEWYRKATNSSKFENVMGMKYVLSKLANDLKSESKSKRLKARYYRGVAVEG